MCTDLKLLAKNMRCHLLLYFMLRAATQSQTLLYLFMITLLHVLTIFGRLSCKFSTNISLGSVCTVPNSL